MHAARASRGWVAVGCLRRCSTPHKPCSVSLPKIRKSLAARTPISVRNVVLFEVEHRSGGGRGIDQRKGRADREIGEGTRVEYHGTWKSTKSLSLSLQPCRPLGALPNIAVHHARCPAAVGCLSDMMVLYKPSRVEGGSRSCGCGRWSGGGGWWRKGELVARRPYELVPCLRVRCSGGRVTAVPRVAPHEFVRGQDGATVDELDLRFRRREVR